MDQENIITSTYEMIILKMKLVLINARGSWFKILQLFENSKISFVYIW